MMRKTALLILISFLIGLGFAYAERKKTFDRIDNYFSDGQYIYFSGNNRSNRYVCKADVNGNLVFAYKPGLSVGSLSFLRSPASLGALSPDADGNVYISVRKTEMASTSKIDERIIKISSRGFLREALTETQNTGDGGEIISLAVYGSRVWYARRMAGDRSFSVNYTENNNVYKLSEVEANPVDTVLLENGTVAFSTADGGLYASYANGLISRINMDGLESYNLSTLRAAGGDRIYLSSVNGHSMGIEIDVVTGEVSPAEFTQPAVINLVTGIRLFTLNTAVYFLISLGTLTLLSFCASRLGVVNGLRLSFCLVLFVCLLFVMQQYGDNAILKSNTMHLRAETETAVKSLNPDELKEIDLSEAFGDEKYLNLYYRFYEKLIPADSTCFYNVYLSENEKFYKAFSKNGYIGESPTGDVLKQFETAAETNEPVSGLMEGSFGKAVYILTPLSDDNGQIFGMIESGFYYRPFQIFADKIFLLLALLFIISIVFLASGSGGFSLPLYRLLQSLANGKYGGTVPAKGNSAQLIRVANSLSTELKEQSEKTDGTLEAYEKFLPTDRIEMTGQGYVTDLYPGLHTDSTGLILFVNLRKYGSKVFADRDEEFGYVNSFMESCAESVCRAKGVVLSFREYGLISVFGKNVSCALEAALQIADNNPDAGIAVVYADSEIGVVGSQTRRSISLVSQEISEAAELERYGESLRVRIVITKKVKALADRQDLEYNTRPLICESNAHNIIYDLFDADDPDSRKYKQDIKKPFEKGVDAFLKGNFAEAGKIFVNILKYNSADLTCRAFALLCEKPR